MDVLEHRRGGLLPGRDLLELVEEVRHELVGCRQSGELVDGRALLVDPEGLLEVRIGSAEVGCRRLVAGESVRQSRQLRVDRLAHQELHELPGLSGMCRLARHPDAPRGGEDARLARVAVLRRLRRDRELQVRVSCTMVVTCASESIIMPTLPLMKLFTLSVSCRLSAPATTAFSLTRFATMFTARGDLGVVGQVRLPVLQHASAGSPRPGQDVVLHAVGVRRTQAARPIP